jgi:Pyruvate/2-oxoacid:ferredoxin oxidoreductase gamma subunit
MKDKDITRGEVILAGSGGGGVKSAGEALAAAASLKYKNVTCVPFYSIAKRGGLSAPSSSLTRRLPPLF